MPSVESMEDDTYKQVGILQLLHFHNLYFEVSFVRKVLASQKLTFSQITVQTSQHSALFITQDFFGKLAFVCLFAGRAEAASSPTTLPYFHSPVALDA